MTITSICNSKVFLYTPESPTDAKPFFPNIFNFLSALGAKKEPSKWESMSPENRSKVNIAADKLNALFEKIDLQSRNIKSSPDFLNKIGLGNHSILKKLERFSQGRMYIAQEVQNQNTPLSERESTQAFSPVDKLLKEMNDLLLAGHAISKEIPMQHNKPQYNAIRRPILTQIKGIEVQVRYLKHQVRNLKGTMPQILASLESCKEGLIKAYTMRIVGEDLILRLISVAEEIKAIEEEISHLKLPN